VPRKHITHNSLLGERCGQMLLGVQWLSLDPNVTWAGASASAAPNDEKFRTPSFKNITTLSELRHN
jgi:hypothetical protein